MATLLVRLDPVLDCGLPAKREAFGKDLVPCLASHRTAPAGRRELRESSLDVAPDGFVRSGAQARLEGRKRLSRVPLATDGLDDPHGERPEPSVA